MKILITGGAGFVGRHFIKVLDTVSNEIVVVDNFIPGGGSLEVSLWRYRPSSNVVFIRQDCRDFFIESRTRFDLVIHLAAVVGGRLTIELNPLAVAEDLSIDSLFWKWILYSKPEHVVSFSSSAAYPISLQSDISSKLLSESMINFSDSLGMPDMTYGWAKLTHEYLGQLAYKLSGIKIACYRPFSGYGSDQSTSYPFPAICKRALQNKGEKVFSVWGSSSQKRDFIHIDDIVDAVLKTYSKLIDGKAINLCTGTGISFNSLAKKICNIVGFDPEIIGDPKMPQGVHSRIGDPFILKSLGWKPNVTLDFGIRDCLTYLSGKET